MRRRVLFPVLTLVMGLGVGLVTVEVVLRLMGFSKPSISQRDDYSGTIRRPGVEYVAQENGVPVEVRFNSDGFRDEDWTVAKPPDTFRIAVLGDSYVEAVQVALHDRFTDVLERALDRTEAVGGKRVHVLTFGVGGFGTAQELMCLRHYAWRYSPDLVVLAVTTGNDVRNNSKALQNDDGRPYFTFVNGTLTLDTSYRRSAAHRRSAVKDSVFAVIAHFRTAQFAYQVWQNRSSLARRALITRAAESIGDEVGLDSWVYVEPTHPLRAEAWNITEGLLALMSREVAERGAHFLVVTQSNGIQVHPDPAVRRAFSERLGVTDLFYPERRIAAAGRRDGYAVVNLAPELLERVTRSGDFLHGLDRKGGGHWNETGHYLAGTILAREISAFLRGTHSATRDPREDER